MVNTFRSSKGKSGWGERYDSAVAWRNLTFIYGENGYHENKCIFGLKGSITPLQEFSGFRIRDFDPEGKLTHKQGKSGYHGCHVKWI